MKDGRDKLKGFGQVNDRPEKKKAQKYGKYRKKKRVKIFFHRRSFLIQHLLQLYINVPISVILQGKCKRMYR